MKLLIQANNKKFFGIILSIAIAIATFGLWAGTAYAVQSPPGCTADNSVVNIGGTPATAVAGDVLTFTVSAGNPASGDGCDITGRTMTLTTPDGVQTVFGPFNYPNGSAVAVVGSDTYTADNADAVNGFWTANVTWDGTLKGTSDLPSTGAKNASVVQVQPLTVVKTAVGSFDRNWDWTIEKSVDDDELILAENETATVNYDIEVDAVSTDTNHQVEGTITITNPADNQDATVTNITDVLDDSGAATTLNCEDEDADTTLPFTLSGGEVLSCTYTKTDASADDTENTVTVTTSGSIPGGADTEEIDWATEPTVEVDECIIVDDSNPLGPQDVEICAGDVDKTLEYDVTFGPQGGEGVDIVTSCGLDQLYPNTATYVTKDDDNDTDETDNDDANVHVVVNCIVGCTLTQGYWKTHNDSFKGGAPTDETWELVVPNGEETAFTYLGGSDTWFNIFWTAPKGGNLWYQLAHQWMAAKLNVLGGADPAEITPELDAAEAWLHANGPGQKLKGKDDAQVKAWASLFGSYNEGSIGPGHCDEQNPS